MKFRPLLAVTALIALLAVLGASIANASPAPKKNKKKKSKQSQTDPLLSQSLMRQALVFMQQDRYDESLD